MEALYPSWFEAVAKPAAKEIFQEEIKTLLPTCFVLCLLVVAQSCLAQHCAPIRESYLSEISVKSDATSIKVRVEYTKRGGRPKEHYQAYLLAYLEKHESKIPPHETKPLIDEQVILSLHTQLIKRDTEGRYEMEVTLDVYRLFAE